MTTYQNLTVFNIDPGWENKTRTTKVLKYVKKNYPKWVIDSDQSAYCENENEVSFEDIAMEFPDVYIRTLYYTDDYKSLRIYLGEDEILNLTTHSKDKLKDYCAVRGLYEDVVFKSIDEVYET